MQMVDGWLELLVVVGRRLVLDMYQACREIAWVLLVGGRRLIFDLGREMVEGGSVLRA